VEEHPRARRPYNCDVARALRVAASSREDILSVLDQHRDELRRLGVRRLGLFGSAARGDLTPTSDVDFVVDLEQKTFDCYMDLKSLLEELLGRRVDLVLTDALKPRLRERILSEALYAEGLPDLP
jgi:predicted nucleotidyltransferase